MSEIDVLRLMASQARLILAMLPESDARSGETNPRLNALRFQIALKGKLAEMAVYAPWERDLAWPIASEVARRELIRRHIDAVVVATARDEGHYIAVSAK